MWTEEPSQSKIFALEGKKKCCPYRSTLFLQHHSKIHEVPHAHLHTGTRTRSQIRAHTIRAKRPHKKRIDARTRTQRNATHGCTQHLHNHTRRFTGLRKLDLSFGRLSGPIPASLGRCAKLDALNLSHNLLEGEHPLNPHRHTC